MRKRAISIALGALALAGLAAGTAHATSYAPGSDARNFATSAGGWTASSAHEGVLCLPGVLCPQVTNSFVATGGVGGPGDGFIQSEYSTVIAALAGTTIGIWESPGFRYRGAGGSRPAKLEFRAARQSSLSELLGLPSASAVYTVELVDLTEPSNPPVPVITGETVPGTLSWESIEPVALARNALALGNRYKIRISTAVSTPLAALAVSGAVGYDNVRLVARGPNAAQLAKGAKVGPAKLKGGKLRVKVRCAKAVAPGKCRMKVAAYWSKKGPKVTKTKKARARGGKRRMVRLKVKPRYRPAVSAAKRLTVFVKGRAAGKRYAVLKRVKVKRAG